MLVGMSEINTVESADGTHIGYERLGAGPPMVLVHGTTADHTRWAPVLPALAERFTLHVVDRRGRGMSAAEAGGEYDVRSEGADVAAVVAAANSAAGRDVYLVGHSYGALCSLEAALVSDAIGRLLLYEPPAATEGHHPLPPEVIDSFRADLARGDRDAVLATFYRDVLHESDATIAAMRPTPMWAARLATAHTLVRESETVETFDISARLSAIGVPVRLLLGTESPPYFRPAAEAVAALLPRVDIVPVPGQAHRAIDLDPDLFVRLVLDFAG